MTVAIQAHPNVAWSWIRGHFSSSALRRQTSGRGYVPEVDGLRFIAILSVVLFHIAAQCSGQPFGERMSQILETVVHNGHRGVQLFFVISGFILGLPFARHRLTNGRQLALRSYYLRRVTRLEPPYVAMMLFRAALIAVAMHEAIRDVAPHLLASLFYVHNLVFLQNSTIYQPAWSLEIEIQFYLLAPLCAWLLFSLGDARMRRSLMLLLITLTGVLQELYVPAGSRVEMSILYWVQYFIAGFLLCDLYLVSWESIHAHWLWDAVCLPLWIGVFWSNNAWCRVWLPLACIVLYTGAFKGPLQRRFFRNPVIATTGGMCYSIYLTHGLVLTTTLVLFRRLVPRPVSGTLEAWFFALVFTVFAFGAGAVYYALLEHPCMDRDWPQKVALWFRSPVSSVNYSTE